MKKLLYIFFTLLSFGSFSQGLMTATEAQNNIIIISPQDVRSRATGNLPVQSLKVKRLSLDTLLKITSQGGTGGVAKSYVDAQIATRTTITQVNNTVAPKMDSVRVKSLLTLKADVSALNSKVETSTFNTALSAKANNSDVSQKENTTDVNAKLGFKAPILNPNFQGDVEINSIGNGVIIKSPNGTRFRLTISNNGDIIATSL